MLSDPTAPRLSPFRMRDHVASGLATPLLDVPEGPLLFGGSWWAIPRDSVDQQYELMRDPSVVAILDDSLRRLRPTVAPGR